MIDMVYTYGLGFVNPLNVGAYGEYNQSNHVLRPAVFKEQ
jgi:hypothetical protein